MYNLLLWASRVREFCVYPFLFPDFKYRTYYSELQNVKAKVVAVYR